MSEIANLAPEPRYLFRQPRALQWFEHGRLVKRCEGERQASRFELFLDLLYVAILANFADSLAEDISGVQLVKYLLILSPSWHVWSDLRELMNSFYNDDLLQRLLILFIMAVLLVYGNNAPLVNEDLGALRATVGAYMVARCTANTAHLVYSFASYHHRAQQRLWFGMASLCLLLYTPLYLEDISMRAKIAVAVVAIVAEESTWMFCYSPLAKRMLRARYTTAVDVPHEIDRFAAFYIIALGEFLYWSIVGSPAAIGFNAGLLRAVWTLVIAFCFNWMYVHNDGALSGSHPIRHSVTTSFVWVTLHLPLIASLLAGGHVAAKSAAEKIDFGDPQRWLLCGSLGVALFCLYIISILHHSHDKSGVLILGKNLRVIMRPIVAIVIICLPLAHQLDFTSILSLIMALVVVCLIWENVTSLRKDCHIWEKWVDTQYPDETETDPEAGQMHDDGVQVDVDATQSDGGDERKE